MRTQDVKKPSKGQNKKQATVGIGQSEGLEPIGSKSYEPKFIRGPTRYQLGRFRTTKTADKKEHAMLNSVRMKPEKGTRPQVKLLETAESENANWSIGKLRDGRIVNYASQKNGGHSATNTFKKKEVDLARAKSLHGKDFTTYSEHINEAFCQLLPKNTPTEHFIRYLEEAAVDMETADIAEVFPFLKTSEDQQKLSKLLTQKSIAVGSDTTKQQVNQEQVNELNHSIELLRAKIYDDRLKKIQFKKRLDLLLMEEDFQNESEEEFWFWVLLKKMLKAVEESLEEQDTEEETLKPME